MNTIDDGDTLVRLQGMLESSGAPDISSEEVSKLVEEGSTRIRGLMACLIRDRKVEIEASILEAWRIREVDPVNRIYLTQVLQARGGNVANVHFVQFGDGKTS